MNKTAYVLMFDTDDLLDYSQIHNKVTHIPGLYSWFHYLQSSYILIYNSTSSDLAAHVRDIIPNKRFLIFEINLATRHGWLPREAWDWIEKMKNEIV